MTNTSRPNLFGLRSRLEGELFVLLRGQWVIGHFQRHSESIILILLYPKCKLIFTFPYRRRGEAYYHGLFIDSNEDVDGFIAKVYKRQEGQKNVSLVTINFSLFHHFFMERWCVDIKGFHMP